MTDAVADFATDPLAAPSAQGYYARLRGLLLTPSAEWARIAEERPAARDVFLRWVAPLAGAFFLAPQLGAIMFPASVAGVRAAPSLAVALYTVLAGVVFTVFGVWAMAWLVDALAKHFEARRDPDQALKLVAYSGAGLWLSGVFGFIPTLDLLMATGIVSIFTLYRGLPVLMQAPQDKALPYAATIVGAGATMAVALMALSGCMNMFADAQPAPRAVTAAPAAMKAAPINVGAELDADKLRRLMPDAIPGGWVRAGVTQNAGGALGFVGPTVEAPFERSGQRIVVRAIDMGRNGAARPIADLRVTRPAVDDGRVFVRHIESEGRYTFEEVGRDGVVRWLTVIDDRVALYAEGRGVTLAELEAAVALIDMVRVEQIARGL